jgi:lipid II:glycine glycyltransferase (peptidoglycan interpeptide bridge formation enzyme)
MEKEKIVGIYPLFLFRTPLITFCYSPPLNVDTLYLGPLFPEIDTWLPAKKQIFLHGAQVVIDRFIRTELKANYIQISTLPGFEDCRFFKWGGYKTEARYTAYLDLTTGTDTLWKNLNRSTRQSIEKAKKEGVSVSEGDLDDLYFIYDLLKKRNRIESPKEFLGSLFHTFSQGHLRVFIARAGDERLSGIVTLIHGDKVTFWIGAPKCSYKGANPNELLLWEAIRWSEEHHYTLFEIEGADDYSLFPFKRKFNGKTILYFQMKWFSPTLQIFASIYQGIFKRDTNLLEI